MKATVLYPAQCLLGEGPLWHAERNSCFWVDIENGNLYEYNWLNKQTQIRQFDYRLTMVVPAKNQQLILGLNAGIARYDLISEKLEWLLDIETEIKESRCNDGACDNLGRLWIGTMNMAFKPGASSLYCIDENLKLSKKLSNLTIANGITWSADNTKMYFIDSPTQSVQSYLFDENKGEIVFEKTVIQIPEEMGTPDGMCIDSEGMLWVAHWGGYGVFRWDPNDGSLLEKIDIPVPHVTSCAFVGENLEYLLITTARGDLNEEDYKKYPESGNTFLFKTGEKGLAANLCRI